MRLAGEISIGAVDRTADGVPHVRVRVNGVAIGQQVGGALPSIRADGAAARRRCAPSL